MEFDDRPKGAKHAVTDINIAIPFISNLPGHLKEYVEPRFWAKVNGTPLRVKGETLPFENSLRTHIALDLDAFDIHRYVEYSPSPLPVKVDDGKLDARISVRFTQAAGKDPSVDIAGKLGLRDVRLSTPEGGPLARFARVDADIASFDPFGGLAHVESVRIGEVEAGEGEMRVPTTEVKDIKVDLHKKNVRIESIATRDGVLALKRRADGSIELPMKPVSDTNSSDQKPVSDTSLWAFALGKLSVDGYRVSVVDASVKPAATHRVAITHLEANDFSTEKGSKTAVNAQLALDRGGSVELASTLALDPLALDAKIDARRIDLVPLRAYADNFATVKLRSANASAKGTLTVRGEGNGMRIAYSGSADLANVATFDTTSREDLVNWDRVKVSGIGFKWSRNDPLELNVAEVDVTKAYARVVVTPEGKINLQQLKGATAENPTPEVEEEAKPRNVRIDRVVFADSRLNFTDHFIKPNYTADVGELHGTVTNLSSDPATRGEVDLQGSYDQSSPVVIAGTINPLSGDLFLDIAAKGKDIELPKLSAYSARYAGYGITQGKLTLDVKYHVEDGKLQGRNNIHLDQLVFGDKVESPDATTLPVLFAVNLLKDSKGAINLELPISGSLEDPQFEISGLITQVVTNLLKKALTNPFSLLTAAFGGGGGGNGGGSASGAAGASNDDLAFIDFDPGRGDIGPAGQKKLDTVAKALLDRPAIKIEMAARVDREKDLRALQQAALQRKVKAAKRSALAAAGKPAPPIEEITLEEGEYPRYLKAVFEQEKIPKPAPKDGAKEAPKEMTTAEMESLLLARIEVPDEELRALAARRAEQVKGYLVGKGQLPAERVLVAAADATPSQAAPSTRVEFTLK